MKLEKYRRAWDALDARNRIEKLSDWLNANLEAFLLVLTFSLIAWATAELILS